MIALQGITVTAFLPNTLALHVYNKNIAPTPGAASNLGSHGPVVAKELSERNALTALEEIHSMVESLVAVNDLALPVEASPEAQLQRLLQCPNSSAVVVFSSSLQRLKLQRQRKTESHSLSVLLTRRQ
uniref:Uncharacterized protein n=1 Tax=Ditylenchus dipsaci TaxID=166011 RepID=A0A915D791_9BILA